MELTIDYNEFKSEVNNFIKKGKEINLKNPTNQEELTQFLEEKKIWMTTCFNYLKTAFSGEDRDSFANSFLKSTGYNFGYTLPVSQQTKNSKADFTEKINGLEYDLRMIAISDIFTNPKLVLAENRRSWSVQQKKIFF